jgi:ABC-type proline/glycine betaine transport system substrate-binding protein
MAYKPKKKTQSEVKKEIAITLNDIDKKITQLEQLPDAKLHQKISFIKSGIRIIGYCFIPYNLFAAAVILIVSESIGIIEELV